MSAEAIHVNTAGLAPITLPGTHVLVPLDTSVCIARQVSRSTSYSMEVQGTLDISSRGHVPLQAMAFRLLGNKPLPEPFLSNCQWDAKIVD